MESETDIIDLNTIQNVFPGKSLVYLVECTLFAVVWFVPEKYQEWTEFRLFTKNSDSPPYCRGREKERSHS